jgi:WbqC-like protein family
LDESPGRAVLEKRENWAGEHALQLLTKRVAVVLQPSYLPWLGYFAQLKHSDVFVIYDDVQFDKNGWRNRNRIKTAQGAQWLTVPVLTTGQQRPTNRDIAIDNKQPWRKKHLAALRQNYARAPYFAQTIGMFETLYEQAWHRLFDLNLACFDAINQRLGLEREIRFASELGVEGQGAERLVGICHKLGADRFYEGAAGRDYIDDALFTDAGIAIEYQDYPHPVYPQLHGEFIPFLSVVDLLFNCGPKSLEILAR